MADSTKNGEEEIVTGPTSSSYQRPTPEKSPCNHYSARLTKVDFTRFDGLDLKSWMYKCVQFSDLDGVGDSDRVKLDVIHLEG